MTKEEIRNRKQPVLKALEAMGHKRIKGFSQCVYIMCDKGQTYGLILLCKTQPGYMKINKRLEHSIDDGHLKDLESLAGQKFVIILEHSAEKVLLGNIETLATESYAIKGIPAKFFPRDALSDITHIMRDATRYADVTLAQLCEKTIGGGEKQQVA